MTKDSRKFGIGDKRGRSRSSEDPYLAEEGLKDPSLCRICGAVYHNKRWTFDPETYARLEASGEANWVTCPACRKKAEGYAEGVVVLRGDYLWEHEDEIYNLLKNEEARAMDKNPLERIIRMARENGDLVIETTEEKLAEHFGRALHKAHQGDLRVSWSDDHDVCRVFWERTV
ncbi:BCAM0308 family protein [Trichloromonas sp.]|uniref:BCAM0308 family protein n=1 Tax=Trichloromonas sp. TaxID=3069249 RepID=UPI002A4A8269|nr:BCAM0308 family protein [Trichloromonas sp.]